MWVCLECRQYDRTRQHSTYHCFPSAHRRANDCCLFRCIVCVCSRSVGWLVAATTRVYACGISTNSNASMWRLIHTHSQLYRLLSSRQTCVVLSFFWINVWLFVMQRLFFIYRFFTWNSSVWYERTGDCFFFFFFSNLYRFFCFFFFVCRNQKAFRESGWKPVRTLVAHKGHWVCFATPNIIIITFFLIFFFAVCFFLKKKKNNQ